MTNLTASIIDQKLAINGGPVCVESYDKSLFHWPIVTEEDEQAVIEVLRAGTMSGSDISKKFEAEFAQWIGTKHALTYPNGTTALMVAFWAVGVGRGDEVIVPSMTYWASAMPIMSLGATPVFADIDRDTLCIDPADIERHITPRTKAIAPVHYAGHPADMDAIMAIAKKHNLKIVEDVSHAQGTLYKGRPVGTFGDCNAMSMMGGKSFAVGEGGMLTTNSDEYYERAIAFAHYSRHGLLTRDELKAGAGIPFGSIKGRLNQTCAAMGRVQLKHYPRRIAEIQSAVNRFWDLLEGVPGIKAHRPPADSGSTMGGWYAAKGLYRAEELGGLPVAKYCEAVSAEINNHNVGVGANFPLHLHPVFNDIDVYNDGKPTRNAFTDRDVRQPKGSLPVAESIADITFAIPWFKHDDAPVIERFAAAFRKVAVQADKLQ